MSSKCMPRKACRCDHRELLFSSSIYASEAGFSRATSQQRAAATSLQVLRSSSNKSRTGATPQNQNAASFPAPLLLPGDDLDLDPQCPPQSRRAWVREKARNNFTDDRRTIYIAAPPHLDPKAEYIRKWSEPRRQRKGSMSEPLSRQPEIHDVADFISAFYHGLPVKLLPKGLLFEQWDNDESKPPKGKAHAVDPSYIGLNTSLEYIGIRTRTTPHGDFSHQLNIDDILDAAISILPDDAYALVFLVEQDLYEDDDDEFVCGRAYGGSRVAVISMARYRPDLDIHQQVEREHAWPASHCKRYLETFYEPASVFQAVKEKTLNIRGDSSQSISISSSEDKNESGFGVSPIQAAVSAHTSLPSLQNSPSTSALSGLWLGRVCRTVSHELGHCFGIAHCVYYACVMQGSASITEDARQPPYLCPVDLSKVLQATGVDEVQHYKALLSFCDKHKDTHIFAAYGAWIRSMLAEIEVLE